jgi:hypothetical protein
VLRRRFLAQFKGGRRSTEKETEICQICQKIAPIFTTFFVLPALLDGFYF